MDRKEKRRQYHREYYYKRLKNNYAEKRKPSIQKSVKKKQDFINSLKTPCQKCGETRLYTIEFHHINNTDKLFNVGAGVWKTNDALVQEANKCVCFCKCCHAEFHYLYGREPENPEAAIKEYLLS